MIPMSWFIVGCFITAILLIILISRLIAEERMHYTQNCKQNKWRGMD